MSNFILINKFFSNNLINQTKMARKSNIKPSNELLAVKQKEIADHKKIADQLVEAAALHLEVAYNLEKDYYGKAFQKALNAFVLLGLARETQRNLVSNMC
jgi:hypothetical protein